MSRPFLVPLLAALAFAACGERNPASIAPPDAAEPLHTASAARERLAARLAVALADPALRHEFATRFATSEAPEGKLQFQSLARSDGNRLLLRLTAGGGSSLSELLADLDAARGLEVYLPVASHREAWHGSADFLVATAASDHEAPVAFDSRGRRTTLSAHVPPTTPVIALVPQEHDFSRPAPAMCAANCGGSGGGGWVGQPPGLYLVGTDFTESHESWLKGNPEFEVHLYGEIGGESEQLGCTGQHGGGPYTWDTNALSWRGQVALLTKADIDNYLGRNAKGVLRIVAWEDDDQPCVPVSDGNFLEQVVKVLDQLYKSITGAKTDSRVITGVKSAYAAYGLAQSVRNLIHGADDFIGLAIERSVVGWAPGTANFVIKGEGAVTNGSLETRYVH
jgi:hypothetical protein